MRVPIFLAIPLALITVSVVWWWGVRGKDFITAPNAQALAAVRDSALEDLKPPDSITTQESTKAIKVTPKKLILPGAEPEIETTQRIPIDLGDLSIAPGLESYLSQAEKGAATMIELATELETKGELQRALLAWERVLDATPADPAQQETARKAVERLRPLVPLWNVDPLSAQSVILCISCDRDHTKTLESVLQEICQQLHAASAGLIDCKLELKEGPKATANAPRQPVAIWFRGAAADSIQSKILTIPVLPDAATEQKQLLIGNIYKLIRDGVRAQSTLRPLIEWQSGNDPTTYLNSAISRRTWQVWSAVFSGKL